MYCEEYKREEIDKQRHYGTDPMTTVMELSVLIGCPADPRGPSRHLPLHYFGRVDGLDGTPGELDHWHCSVCGCEFNSQPITTGYPMENTVLMPSSPEPEGQGLWGGLTVDQVNAGETN